MEYMLMPLKRYADFSGRSRRMEFWMWQLFNFIVYIGFMVLGMVLLGGGMMMVAGDPNAAATAGGGALILFALYAIYGLAVIIPSIAVAVRRLHDTNRSGWWILLPIVPYIVMVAGIGGAAASPDAAASGGAIVMLGMAALVVTALVLLVFYLLEGTKGPNRFGPDPKGGTNEEVFA